MTASDNTADHACECDSSNARQKMASAKVCGYTPGEAKVELRLEGARPLPLWLELGESIRLLPQNENAWFNVREVPAHGKTALPEFAEKVVAKLRRVRDCFEDNQDTDIGRVWLDLLTSLGLLTRTQRSPALWEITDDGSKVLEWDSARDRPPLDACPICRGHGPK
ncbi:hypothetical protein [Pseudomonas guariconensis]|uniref:hypothetical protein n=1 Tax=Pseudomonas guariconensis TaxID=1288410 RepID=UPI003906D07B